MFEQEREVSYRSLVVEPRPLLLTVETVERYIISWLCSVCRCSIESGVFLDVDYTVWHGTVAPVSQAIRVRPDISFVHQPMSSCPQCWFDCYTVHLVLPCTALQMMVGPEISCNPQPHLVLLTDACPNLKVSSCSFISASHSTANCNGLSTTSTVLRPSLLHAVHFSVCVALHGSHSHAQQEHDQLKRFGGNSSRILQLCCEQVSRWMQLHTRPTGQWLGLERPVACLQHFISEGNLSKRELSARTTLWPQHHGLQRRGPHCLPADSHKADVKCVQRLVAACRTALWL